MTRSLPVSFVIALQCFACSSGTDVDAPKGAKNALSSSTDAEKNKDKDKDKDKDCTTADAGVADAGMTDAGMTDAGKIVPRCTGSDECSPNERCSTERGECLPPIPSDAGIINPPIVCAGICEPKPATCTGFDCKTGEHCSTERGECLTFASDGSGVVGPAVCFGTCEKTCGASADCPYASKCIAACIGTPPPFGYVPPPSYCAPAPVCYSTGDCGNGQTCSVESGDCRAPSGGNVPGVCAGVCESIALCQ